MAPILGSLVRLTLFALVSLVASVSAARVEVPRFRMDGVKPQLTQECKEAIQVGNNKCFVEGAQAQARGASVVANAAANPGAGSTHGAANNGTAPSAAGLEVGLTGTKLCTDAAVICKEGCTNSITKLDEFKVSCSSSSSTDPACHYVDPDKRLAEVATDFCEKEFREQALHYEKLAGRSIDAQKKYLDASKASKSGGGGLTGAMSRNPWTTAMVAGGLGAGAGLLAGKMFGGGDDKDEKKQAEQQQQQITNQAIVAAGCQDARSVDISECESRLIQDCGNVVHISSERCQAFTNRHCGFSAPNGGVNNAPGLGSQLCKDAMASKFCGSDAKKDCYSCRRLKDLRSALCQAQPGACQYQNSDQQMAQFKYVCSDDPVFSDPRYANLVATPPPNGTIVGGSPASSGNGAGLGQPTNGSRVTGRGTASHPSLGAQATSGSSGSRGSEIAPSLGPSVFTQSQQTMKTLCDQGELNNCGPRARMRR